MATKPLRDYIKRGPFDDIDTPFSATDYLIPSLVKAFGTPFKHHPIIWETAPPRRYDGKLAVRLRRYGFHVKAYPGVDYFGVGPGADINVLVTNPPFSLKEKWVKRTMELGLPWALLLPIAALGVRRTNLNIYLSKCQIILPPRRVDFTGRKSPWQYVAWFTHGFDLPGGQLIPVDDEGERIGLTT